jgi:hypothetical protein
MNPPLVPVARSGFDTPEMGERENTVTRKRFNVVTIAAMIAILALGSLGLGYAAWSTNLNIGASASTGNANVDYVGHSNNEYYSEDSNNWGSPISISYAGCSVAPGGDANNLTVAITNMFPGYRCEVVASIKNTGTVPVVAGMPTILPALPDADLDYDAFCAGAIQPGDTKNCTASIWLDHADTDFDNDAFSATFNIPFTQATP